MGCRFKKTTAIKILQAVVPLLLASSANSAGIIDRIHTLAEEAWEAEYIPDSGIPTTPLTEYENFEVTELFRAVTIEELEAAVTDGYPMAWLEETLKDETIPWEDRYWLDCRMRSIFAQDLHTFFNPAGSPVHIEADFIGPGEDYWREHLMVNPIGRTDVPDNLRPTNAHADPGYILSKFGNRVGELAEVYRFVSMSRDASIAAVVSGGPSACFMYPDGTFKEVLLEQSADYESVVSANGEVIAFECVSSEWIQDPITHEYTRIVGDVYFYDPSGNLLNRVSPPVIFSPGERGKLSSDGRYFCDNLCTGELFFIEPLSDSSENLVSASNGGRGRGSFNFSPDGSILCSGGTKSTGILIQPGTDQTIWESSEPFIGINDCTRVHCSNRSECISFTTQHGSLLNGYSYVLEVFINNQLIYRNIAEERYNGETIVSPNGHFLLSQKDDVKTGDSGIPTVIRQIRREASE